MADKISEILDIPEGMISESPRIEMWGKEYVSVENCKKIKRFDTNVIEIEGKKHIVRILGFDLRITGLSKGFIEIKGDISSVETEKGGV